MQFLAYKGCCPDLCIWTMMLAERYSLKDTFQTAVSYQHCSDLGECFAQLESEGSTVLCACS